MLVPGSQTPEALPGESAMSSPMLMKEQAAKLRDVEKDALADLSAWQERFLSLVEKQCEASSASVEDFLIFLSRAKWQVWQRSSDRIPGTGS